MTLRTTSERWLNILGIGENGVEGLSPSARTALAKSSVVFGGQRHLSLAASLINGQARPWSSPLADTIPDILARRGETISVLASGDPFCFGIGTMLLSHVPIDEIACLPVLSAVGLARSRLGWSEQDSNVLSFAAGR